MSGPDRQELLDRADLQAMLADAGSPVRGRSMRCPHPDHEDRHASASYKPAEAGKPERWVCHSCEAGGTAVDLLVAAEGLDVAAAFERLRELAGEAPRKPKRAKPKAAKLPTEALLARWCAAVGDPLRERLWELRRWTPEALEALEVGFDGERLTLPIRDHEGALVNVCRYTPSPNGSGPKLLALSGRPRDLYPAPETIDGEPLWLLEGEPDAIAARAAGLPAVAVPGVQGWRAEYAARFAGRSAVVCFDCDKAGRPAAETVAADLAEHAAEVRVLDLEPERDDGFDLSDYIADAESPEELTQAGRLLSETAEAVEPLRNAAPTLREAEVVGRRAHQRSTVGALRLLDPARDPLRQCAAQEPTDAGNAQRFALRSKDTVLAVVGDGWAIWDETRYASDDAEATKATRLALDATEAIKHECDVLREQGVGDDPVKARFSHYLRSQSRPRIEAMMKLARVELAIDPEWLDADADLLNTPSGTVHLPTGELRPHNPADLLTLCTGAAYDPGATAPTWERHLERILPDPDHRAYFQRVCGYAATGHTIEQVFFVNYGPGGTGKSTTARALSDALGDYAVTAAAETFMQSRRGGGETRSDLVRLRGSRLVTMSEATDGLRFDERLIKEITGGEKLTARGLYSSEVSYTPAFVLFISCNAVPSFDGADFAMRRRLRVNPFEAKIPDADQDGKLAAKLAHEAPGILAWAVEGAREWYAQGLGNCAAVETASAASSQAADPVGQFIEDECVRDPAAFIPAADLAGAFGRWAERHRQPELGATRLGNALSKHGLQTGREYVNGKRVRVRKGVRFAAQTSSGTARDGFSRESYTGPHYESLGGTRPGSSHSLVQAESDEAAR